MPVHVLNATNKTVLLAAAVAVVIGVGMSAAPDAAVAAVSSHVATHDLAAATEVGAARRQRQARRRAAPDNANATTAPPPSRPAFGYGIGDNSRYGGG